MGDFLSALGALMAAVGLLLTVIGVFLPRRSIVGPISGVVTGLALCGWGLYSNGYRSIDQVASQIARGELPRSAELIDGEELHALLQDPQVFSDDQRREQLSSAIAQVLALREIDREYWPALQLYEAMAEDLLRGPGEEWPPLPGSEELEIRDRWVRPQGLWALSADELQEAFLARRRWEEKGKQEREEADRERVERSLRVLRAGLGEDEAQPPTSSPEDPDAQPSSRAQEAIAVLKAGQRDDMVRWHARYSQWTGPVKDALARFLEGRKDPDLREAACLDLRNSLQRLPGDLFEAPDEKVTTHLTHAYLALAALTESCLLRDELWVEQHVDLIEQYLGHAASALEEYSLKP